MHSHEPLRLYRATRSALYYTLKCRTRPGDGIDVPPNDVVFRLTLNRSPPLRHSPSILRGGRFDRAPYPLLQIPNPACQEAPGCGKWTKPKIPNPGYKGTWKAPMIDNPDYKGPWSPKKIEVRCGPCVRHERGALACCCRGVSSASERVRLVDVVADGRVD